EKKLPDFDRGFSALLEDASSRGLTQDTLILAYGEFGRTPKINKDMGRDHWGPAASLLFAGAGVRGGQVIGQTDKQGASVTYRPWQCNSCPAVAPGCSSLPLDPRAAVRTRNPQRSPPRASLSPSLSARPLARPPSLPSEA